MPRMRADKKKGRKEAGKFLKLLRQNEKAKHKQCRSKSRTDQEPCRLAIVGIAESQSSLKQIPMWRQTAASLQILLNIGFREGNDQGRQSQQNGDADNDHMRQWFRKLLQNDGSERFQI